MAKSAVLLFAALCIATAMHSVYAATDIVRVRLLPGYPSAERSAEQIDLRIERLRPAIAREGQPVDAFFDAVAKALRVYGISDDWAFVLPDGAFIEISIDIGGNRRKLASAHTLIEKNPQLVATERGAESLDGRDRQAVLKQQSQRFLEYRAAFEQIMALVAERLRARIP